MSDSDNLPRDVKTHWFEVMESEPAFEQVFIESDVDIERSALQREDVTERRDGRIRIRLKHTESEGDYISATGVFERDSEEVHSIEIDSGVVAAPLCGHGTIWRYEGGEIHESDWVS